MSGRGKVTSGRRERRRRGDRLDNRDMHHDPTRGAAHRGFTLIELMIVVAVMAVIALVAVPSYQDTMRKSRRADAIAGMARLQQMQERYRGQNTTYASAAASMPLSWGQPTQSPEGHYDLSISGADAIGYTVTATAKASSPQFGDTKCRSLSVTVAAAGQINTKSTNAAGDVDNTNANRCWVR
jgi:type IV pilus assembly protein PilE